jgi:hypothetical protein
MSLVTPTNKEGRSDVNIDDLITVFLDIQSNEIRSPAAPLLIMHLICRPIAADEPLPRPDFVSWSKFSAKGTPTEVQTILGWLVNTRTVMLSLSDDEYRALTNDVARTIKRKKITHQHLQTLIGRLMNLAVAIPLAAFFLNRLRAIERPDAKAYFRYHLKPSILKDLHIWLDFLKQANIGISLNLLTTRLPSHIAFLDSWPSGLGGFLSSGTAWK